MIFNTKTIGNYGEDIACTYLKRKGHRILARNFITKHGEIDIISRINNIIVFTEVKSRYSTVYGAPRCSVTISKQRKIRSSARYYLYINKCYNLYVRFDVIEILFNHYDNSYKVNYIENAFT